MLQKYSWVNDDLNIFPIFDPLFQKFNIQVMTIA